MSLRQLADVDALLASGDVARFELMKIDRRHPVTAHVKSYYVSTFPYETKPADAVQIAFEPVLLSGWDYRWSRVAGSTDELGATTSGPAEVNAGVVRLANADGQFDHWETDGYELDAVTSWIATFVEHGLGWDADISGDPVFSGRGRNPVRGVGRIVEFELEGIEADLEGVFLRTETFLGLGNGIRFELTGAPNPGVIAYTAAQKATSSLEVAFNVRFFTGGVNQRALGRGNVASGSWEFTRNVGDEVRFRLWDGASFAFAGGLVPTGKVCAVRGTWRASDGRIALWVDGELAGTAIATAGWAAYHAADSLGTNLGNNGPASLLSDAWYSDVELRIDQDRTDEEIEAQAAPAPIALGAASGPTFYWSCNNELDGATHSLPDLDGNTLALTLGGGTHVATETGDPALRGVVLPTLLGRKDRAELVITSHLFREGVVHGGNRESGDRYSVRGMGPVDAAGRRLRMNRSPAWTSSALRLVGGRIEAGAEDDFGGLLVGQDIEISGSGGNNGRYTLRRDSTPDRIFVAGVIFVTEGPGVAITVTVVGASETSADIEFRAARNEIHVPDLVAANYLNGFGTAIVITGSASNDGSYVANAVRPGVLEVSTAVVAEPAGRLVKLSRTVAYNAGSITLANFGGHAYIVQPNDGQAGFGVLKKGTKITLAGTVADNATFTVISAGPPAYGPAVTPLFTAPGVQPGVVTIIIVEETTRASFEGAPAKILVHDEAIDVAGMRTGGTVEAVGSASNDGIAWTIDAALEGELQVSGGAVVDEPASAGAVTLEFDALAATDVTVTPARGHARLHADFEHVAIAVRGCDAGGAYVETGGALMTRALTVYGSLVAGQIDAAAMSAWDAADPYAKGWQYLAAVTLPEVCDDLVRPGASWGSDLGDTITAAIIPVPGTAPAAALSVDRLDGLYSLRPLQTLLPARRRPLLGVHNGVVLRDDEIPGIVRELEPELFALLRETWQVDDREHDVSGRGAEDDPVETLYATLEGLAAAAAREAALWSVERRSYELEVPLAVISLDRFAGELLVTDTEETFLAGGRRAILLEIVKGRSNAVTIQVLL